jgi:hypothetical protein
MTPLPEMKFLEMYGTPYDYKKNQLNIDDETNWENCVNRVVSQSNFQFQTQNNDKNFNSK